MMAYDPNAWIMRKHPGFDHYQLVCDHGYYCIGFRDTRPNAGARLSYYPNQRPRNDDPKILYIEGHIGEFNAVAAAMLAVDLIERGFTAQAGFFETQGFRRNAHLPGLWTRDRSSASIWELRDEPGFVGLAIDINGKLTWLAHLQAETETSRADHRCVYVHPPQVDDPHRLGLQIAAEIFTIHAARPIRQHREGMTMRDLELWRKRTYP